MHDIQLNFIPSMVSLCLSLFALVYFLALVFLRSANRVVCKLYLFSASSNIGFRRKQVIIIHSNTMGAQRERTRICDLEYYQVALKKIIVNSHLVVYH